MACWCSLYLALASALGTWTQHTLTHSFMRNLGCAEGFHPAPQRPCLAEQEGSKGSRFTAWREGTGRVFEAQSTGVWRHSQAHHELGSSLPPRSHRPVFHLVPPRTWWFGFPMPWQAARGLHPQAQGWLRAQRSSVGGAQGGGPSWLQKGLAQTSIGRKSLAASGTRGSTEGESSLSQDLSSGRL